MARNKRKRRKRKQLKYDLITEQVPEIKSSCRYAYRISQQGKRIMITLANNKGDSFVITYYDSDCHDSRDNSRMSDNQTLAELKRLLGHDSGIMAHKNARFRQAVIS